MVPTKFAGNTLDDGIALADDDRDRRVEELTVLAIDCFPHRYVGTGTAASSRRSALGRRAMMRAQCIGLLRPVVIAE